MSRKSFLKKWPTWLLLTILLLVGIGWNKIRSLDKQALVLAESGKASIALLSAMATGIKTGDINVVMAGYHKEFSGSQQVIWTETFSTEMDGAGIFDWIPSPEAVDTAGVKTCLETWMAGMTTVSMSKFKLDSVEEVTEDGIRIRAILWVRALRENGATYESQARFRLWLRPEEETYKIVDQALLHGESVRGKGLGFREVAMESGLDFKARANPMFGTPEWEPKRFGIIKYSSAGVSAADYDHDGFEDLFFSDGAQSALYRNLGNGKFQEVTAQAGLEGDLTGFNVALFLDFDNDGSRDLFLGGLTVPSRLYRNRGDGTFEDITHLSNSIAPLTATASAADYDNDGDIDLYLGRYLDPRKDLPTTLFYTRNGAGNSLLRNDGGGVFTDVTQSAGVRDGGLTLSTAWGDYDQDGDQDLYVANDFGRNTLFRNESDGTFSDVSAESGTLDFGFGMSAAFGDVDNDGDLDLYVSNVHSGQRWYGQAATLYNYLFNSLKQGAILEDMSIYREIVKYTGSGWQDYGDGMVKGNSLFINNGKGKFTDIAESSNANPFGWYWSSVMFDYDNDGLQDIYAANGWITGKEYDDL